MASPAVIVFDLDDTLYFERDYVRSGLLHIADLCAAILNRPALELADYLMAIFASPDKGKVFNRLLERFPELAVILDVPSLVQAYRDHMPRIKLNPGVEDILTFIERRGDRLAVITDGFLQAQKNKMTALGVADRFERVIFTDAWGRQFWKPHEKPYASIEESFINIEPTSYWYIADNPEKDFVTPNRRGWRTVRFQRPEQIRFTMQAATPDYAPQFVATEYSDLISLIYGK